MSTVNSAHHHYIWTGLAVLIGGKSKTDLTISIFLLSWVKPTDYGHTKAKSLILCRPNSDSNPK